jgi:homoserine dehydrogenase
MAFGVGVIGAGTVGGGVIETLLGNSGVIRDKTGLDVVLKHVADVNHTALAQYDLGGVTVSNDAQALIDDPEVQVVCELIGGLNPAKKFITAALEAGKHVVTANKMLLAKHGPELSELAASKGVALRYEAAVGGTIPIIKAIRESLAANHIHGVYGILNGTCNYILTRMQDEGLEFDDALQQAIASGFAETPPDLDIEGHDTAHKCQILASLCFNTRVALEDIYVEGITKVSQLDVLYADELGYDIKLLAVALRAGDAIEARVHPMLVPQDHLLAGVRREFNAVYVDSDIADKTFYYGRGAGKFPTASAVVADIIDIATLGGQTPRPAFSYTHSLNVREHGLSSGRYYLRLTTQDNPGVLGQICTTLGKHGVSIATCFQHEESDDAPAHVVIMSHMAQESAVQAAVAEIDQQEFISEPTRLLRVLVG